MPAYSSPSNAPYPSVAPQPIRFGVLTFGGAGSQTTAIVQASGLPGIRAWFFQTAGAGAVTVQLEFADGNLANNVIQWDPLVPLYGILLNVPSLNQFSLGSRLYRATVTSTGAATVKYRLNATLN